MDATTVGENVASSRISRRDRMFAVLTANVAMAFALAGWYQAEKQVLPVNSLRVIEIDILQRGMRIKIHNWNSRSADATGPSADSADREKDITQEIKDTEDQVAVLTKQIGTTLVITYAWKYLMYLTAAILEVAAFLGTTRHRRKAHLAAACAILISTICTIVAMKLLISPSFGGMESLAKRSYIYIALIQGGYGAVLLVVTLSRWKPAAQRCPLPVPQK